MKKTRSGGTPHDNAAQLEGSLPRPQLETGAQLEELSMLSAGVGRGSGCELLSEIRELLQAPEGAGRERLIEMFPELALLLKSEANVTPEGVTRAGTPDIEFQRTALALALLRYFADGSRESYAKFTAHQPAGERLSWKGFSEISQEVRSFMADEDQARTLITTIILSGAAKVGAAAWDALGSNAPREARDGAWKLWKNDGRDHDASLALVLAEHPEVSPSFNDGLSAEGRFQLRSSLESDLNIGQLMRLENVEGCLAGFFELGSGARQLHILHSLCDIAAAKGHLDPNGSVLFTEALYQRFKTVREALALGDADEAYAAVLTQRAQEYGLDGSSELGRAVTRIAAMADLEPGYDVERLKSVLLGGEIDQAALNGLVSELSRTGLPGDSATVPYYAPALLNNLLNWAGPSEQGQMEVWRIGLNCLAEIYSLGRERLDGRAQNVLTLHIREIADLAKSPQLLAQAELKLEPVDAHARLTHRSSRNDSALAARDPLEILKKAKEEVIIPPRTRRFSHPYFERVAAKLDDYQRECASVLTKQADLLLQGRGAREEPAGLADLRSLRRELHVLCSTMEHRFGQLSMFGRDTSASLGALLSGERDPLSTELRAHMNRAGKEARSDSAWLRQSIELQLRAFVNDIPTNIVQSNWEGSFSAVRDGLTEMRKLHERIESLGGRAGGRHSHELETGPFNVTVLEHRPTAGLCRDLAAITNQQRYRPLDPRIHQHGIAMREMLAERLQEYLEGGAQIATCRSGLGSLLGYAIRMGPAATARFRPELYDQYQTYGRVSYLPFVVVAPAARSSGVYRMLMETTCRELCDADVLVGRVQEDSFRAALAHCGYAGQLFAPDTIEVQSDLDPVEGSVFRTRSRTRAIGFVVPLSDQWIEEFSRTRPSKDELAGRISDIVNRRSPGYNAPDGTAMVEAWEKSADRLLYLRLQSALRSELEAAPPSTLDSKIRLDDRAGSEAEFELRQVLSSTLPSYCVELLRRRGIFASSSLSDLEAAQVQNMALRTIPAEPKLRGEINGIIDWRKKLNGFLVEAFGPDNAARIRTNLEEGDLLARSLKFPQGLTFPGYD